MMRKITLIGAGSTVFAKNLIGDCMQTESIRDFEFALYDINEKRLQESETMLKNIQKNSGGYGSVVAYSNRKEALRNADFVINTIQVGGYEPSTVIDFEIPKKYGLRQTIGDTLGIGGVFRGLRTIPVLQSIARDMEEVCPNALFLNYTNPMAILMGAWNRITNIQGVGLCHSVQSCVPNLLNHLQIGVKPEETKWKIAGINHQAWLLNISKAGLDLYPEIKKAAKAKNTNGKHWDMVRFDLMEKFGYYVTESSEHSAEYMPYYIKSRYPELIEKFNIPLDEYPRRCITQINEWNKIKENLVHNAQLTHQRTHEYASYIIEAVVTNKPYIIAGNVMNNSLITNLPNEACVEVACIVDRNGITPSIVGKLPEQCAALNRTNINMQLLTIEAALTLKKEYIYMSAMLDPHTSSELSLDDIKSMCDDLILAHGDLLPKYK
ncbi:MAG: alpha-glucosidase/alpha-galactosidase [Haloplasmataceae bacterium]|nr:alpha-glucosidase/alpha-galactosidase [Haloplasmataceae bacterium]